MKTHTITVGGGAVIPPERRLTISISVTMDSANDNRDVFVAYAEFLKATMSESQCAEFITQFEAVRSAIAEAR